MHAQVLSTHDLWWCHDSKPKGDVENVHQCIFLLYALQGLYISFPQARIYKTETDRFNTLNAVK